jgi:hypothetical protein
MKRVNLSSLITEQLAQLFADLAVQQDAALLEISRLIRSR